MVLKPLVVSIACLMTAPAMAQGIAEGSPEDILSGWINSVVSGDPDRVAAVLAPEFQIMRGNGVGYTATEYVARGLPQANPPEIKGVVATQTDDVLVIRYALEIDETIDGQKITRDAPRLTVFRRIGATWFVVGHANFARPE